MGGHKFNARSQNHKFFNVSIWNNIEASLAIFGGCVPEKFQAANNRIIDIMFKTTVNEGNNRDQEWLVFRS